MRNPGRPQARTRLQKSYSIRQSDRRPSSITEAPQTPQTDDPTRSALAPLEHVEQSSDETLPRPARAHTNPTSRRANACGSDFLTSECPAGQDSAQSGTRETPRP